MTLKEIYTLLNSNSKADNNLACSLIKILYKDWILVYERKRDEIQYFSKNNKYIDVFVNTEGVYIGKFNSANRISLKEFHGKSEEYFNNL